MYFALPASFSTGESPRYCPDPGQVGRGIPETPFRFLSLRAIHFCDSLLGMDMNDLPPARAAATLIIFRDREDSPAELLMMERSRKMVFAAWALVFPGGAVDEADAELAAAHGGGLAVDEAAARIAAIRETLEESGLVLGLRNCPDADLACQIRERMKQGESFAALLGEYGRSEEHTSEIQSLMRISSVVLCL